MKLYLVAAGALTALSVSIAFANQSNAGSANAAPVSSAGEQSALEQWRKAYEVFSHPRCANCHVPEDNRPRWSGASFGLAEGEWLYHGMNIDGGDSRNGAGSIPCSACHATSNSELPHGPPGAPGWALAPVEMVWWKKSSQEICEQIKDPARTGGRTLQAVIDHIGHDALVLWGWDPGPGREAAPYSADEIVASLNGWSAAGAPCPAPGE